MDLFNLNLSTGLSFLLAGFLAYLVGRWAITVIKNMSWMWASGLSILLGTASLGFGIGELNRGVGLPLNQHNIVSLANSESGRQVLKDVLEFQKAKMDKMQSEELIKDPRLGGTLLAIGIGMIVVGIGIVIEKSS